MMRALLLSMLCLIAASAIAGPIPADTRQLVVVTTADWNATRGTLARYERARDGWKLVGLPTPVMLGRTGSAWGDGLHGEQAREGEPEKREGDGKAPAGAFAIGTAFGYAPTADTALAYDAMTADDWCVDVPDSPLYNRIVGEKVEGSTEPMRRDLHANGDRRYALGFVIEHNAKAARGAGSCIFAHLWSADGETTAGCTAMSAPAMASLAAWLDRRAKPTFVLLPRVAHDRVRTAWGLPSFDVPSAAVAIVRDGVVETSVAGRADLDAAIDATSRTRYRLASVTKQFTAAAILLLAEDGKLGLDDLLAKHLPALASKATVREALLHTSGLVDYEDVMPATLDRPLDADDVLALVQSDAEGYFAHGARWRYSNTGYVLLGLVVERASGMAFGAFLRTRIFEPLAMSATLGPSEPRAYGHSRDANGWRRTDQSTTSATPGDGGVYASLDDLAKWNAALDGDFLAPASRALMFTPAVESDDPAVRYGAGYRLTGDTQWHSGETIGFRHVIVRWPDERAAIVVLVNRDDAEPYEDALALAKALGLPTEPRARAAEAGPPSG